MALTTEQAQVLRAQTAAAAEQLGDVKGAATTWGQTIAGLAGLGGILTLIQGETTLGDLKDWAEVVAVVLLLLALGLAAYAIYEAMIAAHLEPPKPSGSGGGGLVSIQAGTEPSAAEGLVNALTTAAEQAAAHLRRSIWTALGSLGCVALVALGFWLFPEGPAPPQFLVRYVDGNAACGELSWSGSRLVTDVSTDAGKVAEIAEMDACPGT